MLKIQRSSNGQVIFILSGEMEEEQIAELEALISSEAKGRRIVLDLKEVTLVAREAISFDARCLTQGPHKQVTVTTRLQADTKVMVRGVGDHLLWCIPPRGSAKAEPPGKHRSGRALH